LRALKLGESVDEDDADTMLQVLDVEGRGRIEIKVSF
jgi:hypothetical protein